MHFPDYDGETRPTIPVRATRELQRIVALPRRPGPLTSAEVGAWSSALAKRPGLSLRPVQAQALYEAHHLNGLFGPIAVGEGKTLITACVPRVMHSARPVLVTLANLVEKTRHEFARYSQDWHIHPGIQIRSYELLGRPGGERTLANLAPDLLIFDEAHRLKNRSAAVVRRVSRYLQENPSTKVVALSGTIAKSGIRDFAHVLVWCLKAGAPIPIPKGEAMEWAEALDDFVGVRRPVGALERLTPNGSSSVADVRRAYQERLTSSWGVVASPPQKLGASLRVAELAHTPGPRAQDAFALLRSEGRAPDGYAFTEAVEMWACARQLALGFCYVFDPRPPDWWLEARYAWAKFVREVLAHSRTYDSEATVRYAVESGAFPGAAPGLLAQWMHARASFKPHQKTMWLDDSALTLAQDWIKKNPGAMVWTEHRAYAEELSRRTGLAYFGREGKDAKGRYIDTIPAESCIASIRANSAGRNLQDRWDRGLVVSPPSNSKDWQQLIGRLHRTGHRSDEVAFDVLIGCAEHEYAIRRSFAGAAMQRDLVGDLHKLLIADYIRASRDDHTLPSMQSQNTNLDDIDGEQDE
jgi:hypothetical protein